MSLPPTSHKPTDDEVVAHFTEIARVGLPIIAYNNPFSTRVDLTPPLLARLAEIEPVRAVKEFSQDSRRIAADPGTGAAARSHLRLRRHPG